MSRPATYARIRIETIEHRIGLYMAKRDDSAVEALQWLAREAGINLNYEHIGDAVSMVTAEINRRSKHS
jgi:hypothetical protein